MDLSQKKLIVVVGPTAVGKTALAIQLAKNFHTEIISADSRQIYKELSIGTAKPTEAELAEVKHHFIATHSIINDYDAARFGDDALVKIYALFELYNIVIVCGGSGLYVKALIEGFDDIPEVPDAIRDQLIEDFEAKGLLWLQNKMRELDPEHFKKIDQKNPMRLMRALEVKLATGQSISTFQKQAVKDLPFKVIKIGLEVERARLYERIDSRMDGMIRDGLFEEAVGVYSYKNKQALQTVGYQEIFGFMDGQYDREEAIRLLKRNSRRYAKRQLTWFKRDEQVKWFKPNDLEAIVTYIQNSPFVSLPS